MSQVIQEEFGSENNSIKRDKSMVSKIYYYKKICRYSHLFDTKETSILSTKHKHGGVLYVKCKTYGLFTHYLFSVNLSIIKFSYNYFSYNPCIRTVIP